MNNPISLASFFASKETREDANLLRNPHIYQRGNDIYCSATKSSRIVRVTNGTVKAFFFRDGVFFERSTAQIEMRVTDFMLYMKFVGLAEGLSFEQGKDFLRLENFVVDFGGSTLFLDRLYLR